MIEVRRMHKMWTAAALAVGLSACSDGFFHEPASAGSVRIAITAQQADGATAAFDKADNIMVRIEDRGSGRSLFSESIPVAAQGGQIRTPIEVDLDQGSVNGRVEIELRQGDAELFMGSSDASLVPGRSTDVTIGMTAVPTSLDVPEIPLFTVFGETFPLEGAVLFATGDPIPGAELEWESRSPTILTVEPVPGGGYQARAIADGEGSLRAIYEGQEVDVDADVRAVVVSAEVDPSSATLSPGQSVDVEVMLFDAGGSPVTDRTVEWASSDAAVATVDDAGTVTAIRVGNAEVTATHEGVSATTIITVRDPTPGVSEPRTEGITVDGATVTANVDPRGLTTTVWFEYGTDPTLSGATETIAITLSGGAGPTDISELLAGLLDNTTYYVRVVAENAQGRTEGEIISFTTLDAPEAPSGLAADPAPSGVGLTWTDNSTSETRFEIERREAGTTTWTMIASPGANAQSYSDTSAPDVALEYRVRACNANGCSAWSSPALFNPVFIGPGVTTLAPSPVGLTTATLRANIESRGYNTTVRFEYGTDMSLAGATQTSALFVPSSSSSASVSRPLTGLVANTTYYVRATGINEAGTTEGNVVAFMTGTVPAAPTGFSATLGLNGGVRLTWIDQSGDETGFEVEREEVPGGQTETLTAAAGAELLVDNAAPSGTLRYRIRSCNAVGCSPWSSPVTIVVPSTGPTLTTLPPIDVLASSATLQAFIDPQGLAADVWFLVATTSNMSGATATPTTTLPAGSAPSTVSEAITGLVESTTYYVRAVATNAEGTTDGAVVSFTTPAPPPIPTAPTDLTVSNSPGGGIQLDWTDNSSNETGFEIEIQVDGGAPTTVTPGAGATQFIDDAPATGLLQYRIRACNTEGCSPFTAPVQWYYGLPPQVIIDPVTAIASDGGTLNARVNPFNDPTIVEFLVSPAPNLESFTVFPSTPIDAGFGAVLTPIATDATGLAGGTMWWVKVRATNRWGTTTASWATFTTSGG